MARVVTADISNQSCVHQYGAENSSLRIEKQEKPICLPWFRKADSLAVFAGGKRFPKRFSLCYLSSSRASLQKSSFNKSY